MDRETWLKLRNTPRKDPRKPHYLHVSRKIVQIPGPDGKPFLGAWSIGSYRQDMKQTPDQQGYMSTPNGA